MVAPPEVSPKRRVAARALDAVEAGMRLGLGSGSTAMEFVELLGARVKDGLDVLCVPTSERTRRQAEGLGIRLSTLDETPELDLDGRWCRRVRPPPPPHQRRRRSPAAREDRGIGVDPHAGDRRCQQACAAARPLPASRRSERLRSCLDSEEGGTGRRSDGRRRRDRPQAGCIGRAFRHGRRTPDPGLPFRRHPRPGSARGTACSRSPGSSNTDFFSGWLPPSSRTRETPPS